MNNLVDIKEYNPLWPIRYQQEWKQLKTVAIFIDIEHVGSTAVPGLKAKPVIDIMASVKTLNNKHTLISSLEAFQYILTDVGMKNRLFLRKEAKDDNQVYHLHIVEQHKWRDRKERMMRDYLLQHPLAAHAYGELKTELAALHSNNSLAYTKAKTPFIQELINKIRTERGLPLIDVWEEE